MATFEPRRRGREDSVQMVQTRPLKGIQSAVKRFTENAIPEDVRRLEEHQNVMTQLQRSCQWRELSREQIAATGTLKRLKHHLVEMDRLKKLVDIDEQFEFELQVSPAREMAVTALRAFRPSDEDPLLVGLNPIAAASEFTATDQDQQQALTKEDSEESAALTKSWTDLTQEILELNEVIQDYARIVHSQGEMIDGIESNIEMARTHTQQAANEVGKASMIKAAILPLTGALVGTLLGGPVGLLAGAKTGALLTAAGGGFLGYKGGQLVKRRRHRAVQENLSKLSDSKKDSRT